MMLALTITGAIHLLLALWLGPGAAAILGVCNGAVALLGRHHASRCGRHRFTLFAAGYLFLLVVVWWGAGTPVMFGLLAVVFAAAFAIPEIAGAILIFALSFYILTPYALPAFLLLTLLWLGLVRVTGRRRLLGWTYGAGFAIAVVTLLPILGLVFTANPQTLLMQVSGATFRSAIGLSLLTATISTAAVLLFGVPLAYAMVRHRFPGKRFLDAAIDLPILVPQTVAGIGLLLLLGPKTPLGGLLASVGIDVAGSTLGIVIAQVFVSSPFLIRSAMSAFAAVPPNIEMSAQTLGASPRSTFLRVVVPLSAGGILSGAVLCWARAISEVGSLMVLAYHPMTAPIFIYDIFTQYGLTEAQPASAILVILCLWLFLFFRWLRDPLRLAHGRSYA